ncbi:MAG: hypothetical protein ACRDH7_07715 [Actinomycetota bacterium]
MKRLVRASFAMAIMITPLLGTYPAFASDPGTLFTCPSTLGGLPLVKQGSQLTRADSWFGEHGFSFYCEYEKSGDPTLGGMRLSAGVIWEENAVSPEDFYCGGKGRAISNVGSNGEMIGALSTDRRAISIADQSTDEGGAHAIPIQPAVDLAAEMLPLAEARAAPCPGKSEGGGSATTGTTGAAATTGDTGTQTQAEPADAGGSNGAGMPLVAGGLVAAVAGAAGSMLLGRGGGGGGTQIAPPADKLFSGQEALDLLHTAGLIEPVLDASGQPIGYRPLGDLQQMLDSASPWQPAFANPVATPDGGTATHLSGVAFQPGPDGTISSITVAVRPGGVATANGATAPVPQPSAEPVQSPGPSLADQLYVAGMQAVAKGIPLDALLNPPDRPRGRSLADNTYVGSIETTAEYMDMDGPISAVTHTASPAPAANAPPADPAQFDRWLTTAGDKTITANDLHSLAPKSLGDGGVVKGGLYKGGHVSATMGDGVVNLTVHAPDSTDSILDIVLPNIEVSGKLSAISGRLVVDIQGQTPDSVIAKAVQKQLNGLNAKLSQAGMGINKVDVVKGAIKIAITPLP